MSLLDDIIFELKRIDPEAHATPRQLWHVNEILESLLQRSPAARVALEQHLEHLKSLPAQV